ncbi:MAG: protein-L-isoaspartate(D-aspartate) O-methyltransferase [Alphaproteobacteria bacterium]|nr:protein-L-isoaspartate(D-aspartate) O-methyltransferase [Alphaproteobacteria bacterium]
MFLRRPLIFILFLTLAATGGTASAGDDYAAERRLLMEEIRFDVNLTAGLTGRKTFHGNVLDAMNRVERHLFVPLLLRPYAYSNRPLPIGYGQTISQPYIVALMTDLLDPEAGQTALEIGTGSGYQAAVLAELGMRVFTMEIIEALAESAKSRLEKLGYSSVTARWGDGYDGWVEHAPFDAIVVTAAADHIPPPLVAQLKAGGRMIIPVGARFMTQQLVLVEKDAQGGVTTRQILPVSFVPFTRAH